VRPDSSSTGHRRAPGCLRGRSWSRQHTAVNQHEEVRVYYRFHPRAGEVLPVFGRSRNGGEPMLILREGGSKSAVIPEWMTQADAAALSVHAPPRMALKSLQSLRRVLDSVLSVSHDDPSAPAHANDSGPHARTTGGDGSTCDMSASGVSHSVSTDRAR
jgi:hypothetical protein